MPAEFFEEISNQKTPPIYRYFDGKDWKDSSSGKTTPIHSPIDGDVVGELQSVTKEEIEGKEQDAEVL